MELRSSVACATAHTATQTEKQKALSSAPSSLAGCTIEVSADPSNRMLSRNSPRLVRRSYSRKQKRGTEEHSRTQ
eukprot:2114946-Rhodomonas_salina.1